MDFRLNDEQQAIADMAGRLFSDHCSDERQAAFDRSGAPFDDELWRKVIDSGLQALALDSEAGGNGLGMTELMLVLEAQGRALAPVPLWRHELAAATWSRFGGPAAIEPVREAMAGSGLLTLSLDGTFETRGLRLAARRDGDGWCLDGTSPAVALAGQSRRALLPASLGSGAGLFAVDLTAAGLRRVEGVFTHGEAVADVVCEGVALPEAALLPPSALPWLHQRAMAAIAALQLGVSAEQLRRTAAYISERRQFDRAIGTFQAAQMQMADGYILLEVLRSSLWQLCYRLDSGADAAAEADATKYLAGEAGHRIGHLAQHLHGGIGVDVSYPIHRFQLWSRVLGMTHGGSASALSRLGDWLAGHEALGWKYDLESMPA